MARLFNDKRAIDRFGERFICIRPQKYASFDAQIFPSSSPWLTGS